MIIGCQAWVTQGALDFDVLFHRIPKARLPGGTEAEREQRGVCGAGGVVFAFRATDRVESGEEISHPILTGQSSPSSSEILGVFCLLFGAVCCMKAGLYRE